MGEYAADNRATNDRNVQLEPYMPLVLTAAQESPKFLEFVQIE